MRRGGGDAGDNPRGRTNIQYNMPVPKFLQQMKEATQSSDQQKTKELEDRLNRDEDFDIQNAIVIREQEEKKKEAEKVDMESFKPKYVSKNDRNGLNALKDEIENKKKEDLKKKQLQLKKMDEVKGDKESKDKDKSSDNIKQSNLINSKRQSIEDAVKQLEKETTKKKQVKKSMLTFDADEDD